MADSSLWLVKNKNGRVRGPLNTADIIQMIRQEDIDGETSVSSYPDGKWKLISTVKVFYDPLMQSLSGNNEHTTSESLLGSLNAGSLLTPESETMVADLKHIKSLKKKIKYKSLKQKKQFKMQKESKTQIIYAKPELDSTNMDNTIGTTGSLNKSQVKSWVKLSVFFISIALIFMFVLYFSSQDNKTFAVLKLPRSNQPRLEDKSVAVFINNALVEYFKSDFSSYIKAQDLFIRASEGDKYNVQAMALLCLVHLELWPFSKQDFYTMRVVSSMVHKTALLNQGGIYSGVCQSVETLIKGEYTRTKNIVDSSLNGLQNQTDASSLAQSFLPIFYYLKSIALYHLDEGTTIISYLDTCRNLLPKWIAPQLLIGAVLVKQQKLVAALPIYNHILKLHKTHKTARIRAGLIEFRRFNKVSKAQQLLLQAIRQEEKVSDLINSEAHLGLAEIFFKKNEVSKSLMHAEKAYSYNPTNKTSRNLIAKLGGLKNIKNIEVRGHQLVYKADQLVLAGKYKEAIAYYEGAFKAEDGKNALIAIKAAKNLYKLNLLDEAIGWLKKAIDADPHMMESYVLMAQFYAQVYDFYNASKILKLANRKSPGNYEVSRGWAYLSLKQESYQNAIQYAQRALKLYEADVESLVILSEAKAKLNKINESLVFATRAKEMEPNSILVQIAFAKAIGNMHGVNTSVHYFRKLINNYPNILEYKMALAKYLFEDEQYENAKNVLEDIKLIQPDYPAVHFYLGRLFMRVESYAEAYESFLQAAIDNPTDPSPVFYIGLLRFKEKKYTLSKQFFKKVIALNPLYPRAYFYLGEIAFSSANYKKAIHWARMETKNNPNLTAPLELAGKSYEKLNQFQNCAKEYQKAIEKSPRDFYFYIRAARCYRKSGLLDLATAILLKASADSGVRQPADIYKELAVIYTIRAASVDAATAYCNYLKLKPTAEDRGEIKRKIQTLEKQIGKKVPGCASSLK